MTHATEVFPNLAGHQYANLTTFRKNGNGVTTPVWFAVEGNKLYIFTDASTGKVKRLRNNTRVVLEPSTARGKPLGPSAPGTVRFLTTPAEQQLAKQALDRKYGLIKKLFEIVVIGIVGRFTGYGRELAYLEIIPAAEPAA
ncbi:MAG: PPOX class F420-dependent oxidoreductase [Chloroflexaceae bacterium]|nr:PPOX class F420-dependent oxidoreductase [Chloroflexaceae bacterium]